MFVMGVDPGLSRCGYGVVEKRGDSLLALAAGVIETDVSDSLPRRLGLFHDELVALLGEYRPDDVVVERVFFQHNVRTAMSVAQASGLVMSLADRRGARVVQYSPNEVKLAVVGYGGATKAQVQAMVAEILGLARLPEPPDAADALALALCHVASEPLRGAIDATEAVT